MDAREHDAIAPSDDTRSKRPTTPEAGDHWGGQRSVWRERQRTFLSVASYSRTVFEPKLQVNLEHSLVTSRKVPSVELKREWSVRTRVRNSSVGSVRWGQNWANGIRSRITRVVIVSDCVTWLLLVRWVSWIFSLNFLFLFLINGI